MSLEKKDFFISYNKDDEDMALWIEQVLSDEGKYSTVIQALDFHAGSNIGVEMDNATKRCERIIAVLSSNFLSSDYTKPEWVSAFMKDPTGKCRKLIPVLIEEKLKIDGLLSSIKYIDIPKIKSKLESTTNTDDDELEMRLKEQFIEEINAVVENRRINRGKIESPFKKKI